MKFFNHDLNFNFDFNFRNLERKQITLIVSIIVSIIILITIISIFAINSHKKTLSFGEDLGENRLFTGKNDSVKVTVSKDYKLKQYNTYLDYLLELRNDNNLSIFVKKLDNSLIGNKTLANLIRGDRTTYIKEFNSVTNLSEITDFTVNNNSASTYNFQYVDTKQNQTYYLQVVFLQIDNNIYVFDFDFPIESSDYNNLVNDFLNNFNKV